MKNLVPSSSKIWLWASSTCLSKWERRARQVQQRSSTLPRMAWFAECRQIVFRSWTMKWQEEERTQLQKFGACWRDPSSYKNLPARWHSACIVQGCYLQGSFEPISESTDTAPNRHRWLLPACWQSHTRIFRRDGETCKVQTTLKRLLVLISVWCLGSDVLKYPNVADLVLFCFKLSSEKFR